MPNTPRTKDDIKQEIAALQALRAAVIENCPTHVLTDGTGVIDNVACLDAQVRALKLRASDDPEATGKVFWRERPDDLEHLTGWAVKNAEAWMAGEPQRLAPSQMWTILVRPPKIANGSEIEPLAGKPFRSSIWDDDLPPPHKKNKPETRYER